MRKRKCPYCGGPVFHHGPTGYGITVFRSEAEKEGDFALWTGKNLADNPYRPGPQMKQWKRGYLRAQKEYKKMSPHAA